MKSDKINARILVLIWEQNFVLPVCKLNLLSHCLALGYGIFKCCQSLILIFFKATNFWHCFAEPCASGHLVETSVNYSC